MVRNDYRRSLILLRSNAPGYAGHVRLERRTLMGSMYFVAQAPDERGVLRAGLIGRGRNGYYACDLGVLRRENQRQYSLSVSFDPRNICGRELEDYRLAVIARVDGGNCRIVLFGNLNGHAEIDWERATAAVCALFTQPPVNPAPPPLVPPNRPAAPDTPILPTPSLPNQDEAPAAPDTPILPTPSLPNQDEAPAAPDTPILPTPSLPNQDEAPAAPDTPILPTPALPGSRSVQRAGDALGMDMDQPWPEEVEPLRELFRTSPAMELAPDGEYVYVSAPMHEMSGYDSCAAGVRVQDGRITGVSYALPSLYSAEPPAGLEEYEWVGDNSRGWWVRRIDMTE